MERAIAGDGTKIAARWQGMAGRNTGRTPAEQAKKACRRGLGVLVYTRAMEGLSHPRLVLVRHPIRRLKPRKFVPKKLPETPRANEQKPPLLGGFCESREAGAICTVGPTFFREVTAPLR